MTRLAAVDMGTNSTRLLVADSDGAGAAGPLTTVERHMHITRLGQGVNATRRLHPDAVQRTLAVLRGLQAAPWEARLAARITPAVEREAATMLDGYLEVLAGSALRAPRFAARTLRAGDP